MNPANSILIISDLDYKRWDTNAEFALRFLSQCNNNGISVHYILPTEPCEQVKRGLHRVGFNYTVLECWWHKSIHQKRHNIRIVLPIMYLAAKKRIKVIAFSFCDELTAGLISIFSFLLLINPTIIWHQHSTITCLPRKFSIKRYVNKLRFLSLIVSAICPVYKGQERILMDRGIANSKIVTLYNGTDVLRFDNSIMLDIRSEQCLDAHSIVVTCIASLIDRKGISYLIKAMPTVLDSIPTVELLIVGDGPDNVILTKLTADLGLDTKIHFLGNRSDVPGILTASDIFILPSIEEPFGLVNIEAMAARKPVIASNVGGIPEIVIDGISGILIPPRRSDCIAQAIIDLASHPDKCKRMGTAGREIVENNFSLDAMVDRYFKLYTTGVL